jgi:hypothetical protein
MNNIIYKKKIMKKNKIKSIKYKVEVIMKIFKIYQQILIKKKIK